MPKAFVSRSRLGAVIGTFGVAACIGAGVAAASGQGDSSSLSAIPGPPQMPNVYAVASSTVSLAPAEVAQTYPVFARSAASPDISGLATFGPFAQSRGANVAQARLLATNAHGESLYAVPASAAVCLGSSDSVISGCSPYPLVAQNEIVGNAALCTPSGDLEFAALLPGDPTDVVAHFSDGSSEPITASNGVISVYSQPGEPVPTSITWYDGSQTLESDTGVPPGTVPSRCGQA